jgi:hypothetical protein
MGTGAGFGDRDRHTDLAGRTRGSHVARWSSLAKPGRKNRAVICRAAKALASPGSPVFAAIACSAAAMAR